jgi:predicted TIM-barrel fold metal-dependent hydrolase
MDDQAERYVLISSDAHAGADLLDYKPYLARELHDAFDAWAPTFHDPWSLLDLELAEDDPELHLGSASFLSRYNWESDLRLEHLNSQGIAAEVIFPNTVPPFYPSGSVGAGAPSNAEEYRLRWAGVQAHNRWLVDFCAQAPGRRGGLAQVFLNDIDDAVAEVRWAKAQGLVGVLIPSDHMTQLVNLFERHLDPFWAVCAELQMPVHRHTITVNPPETDDSGPAAEAVGAAEVHLFFQRGLGHLVLGGVLERHPDLRFVFTETGVTWIAGVLQKLDYLYAHGNDRRSTLYPHFHRALEQLSMSPTDYFRRNCMLGASLMLSADVAIRHEVGVDRIMWGADYPHHEGTFPHTLAALRLNFADVPESEVRAMTSLNAAGLYGFDLGQLQRVADRIGPSPDEVATPISVDDLPRDSRSMTIADALEADAIKPFS